MVDLEELNISDTSIEELNVLVVTGEDGKVNELRFPKLTNLQATGITSLTSIAGLVLAEQKTTAGAGNITWNLGESFLASDPYKHVQMITNGITNGNKTNINFTAPTVTEQP